MLKNKYNAQPRKKVKIDPLNDADYNQFGGQIEEESNHQHQQQLTARKYEPLQYDNEHKQYLSNFKQIKQQPDRKFKKLQPQIKQSSIKQQDTVKLQEKSSQQKIVDKKKKNCEKTLSNWQIFKSKNASLEKKSSDFVAIDCEFVKCGDKDSLARISLISQYQQVLYDSYIRPQQKITNYVTEISGITYAHIKKAPLWSIAIHDVKKILKNKILIGHTVDKDLEVCGLLKWNGIKMQIDISQSKYFKQNGKIQALRKLALKYLGKNIQEGWHSSIEDAKVTMDLFKHKKIAILKQLKVL